MQPIRGIMMLILQLAIVVQSWDIDFRCYTKKDKSCNPAIQAVTVDHEENENDFKELRLPAFHNNSRTIILIHGFKGDAESWPEKAKNKLFDSINEDLNVITVDWRKGAKMRKRMFLKAVNYPRAANNTHPLGKQTARFINTLVNQGYLENVKNVHLVGHSLGAQAAGYACREYTQEYLRQNEKEEAEKSAENGIIGRLTALDPAKPHFETTLNDWISKISRGKGGSKFITMVSWVFMLGKRFPKCFSPISKNAAHFVDIIHTYDLGMELSVGHADFYPNGGRKMPSCDNKTKRTQKNLCNHSMAHKYWVESIADSKQFYAYNCNSYAHFKKDCITTEAAQNIMGYHSTKSEPRSFYLDTTSSEPYWEVCTTTTGRNNSKTLAQFGNNNPTDECPAEFDSES